MKKTLFGVLALTSAVSFANVSGYVKSNSEIKSDRDVTTAEDGTITKIVDPTYELHTKLDLGFFLDENKDNFLFTGARLEGKAVEGSFAKYAYVGARANTKVTSDAELTLTGIYSNAKENKEAEEAVIEHLKAQNLWNSELEKDEKKDDKIKFLREKGYKLSPDKETLLISGLLNGKGEGYSYSLGSIITTKDFEAYTDTVDSFAKAEKVLGPVKLEGELNHVLGLYKIKDYDLQSESDIYSDFASEFGKLSGSAKLSSTNTGEGFSGSTKVSFELPTIKSLTVTHPKTSTELKHRFGKAGIENEAKYVNSGLEVSGKLNYNNEYSILTNPENKQKDVVLLHKPVLGLSVKYSKGGLTLTSENKDEIRNVHNVGEAIKLENTANLFTTANKLAYAQNGFEGRLVADYAFGNNFVTKPVYNHLLVTGAGVSYDKNDVKLSLDGRYSLGYHVNTATDQKAYVQGIYGYSRNEVKKSLNDSTTLTATLNVSSNLRTGTLDFSHIASETYVKPEIKVEYAKDKWTYLGELNAKYKLGYEFEKGKDAVITNTYAFGGKTELGHKFKDTVEVIGGVAGSFNSGISNKEVERAEEGISKSYIKDFKFDGYTSADDIKKITEELEPFKTNEYIFDVTPSLRSVLKFVDGKLIVEPKVEATFKFIKELGDKKVVKFNHITGKGNLKIEYRW